MTFCKKSFALVAVCGVALSGFTGLDCAHAQTKEEFRAALQSKPGAKTRAISVPGREAPPRAVSSIDADEIEFELNSDVLTPLGAQTLDNLAAVLNDPDFAGVKIELIGHTDATGDADYNQDLSLRRAYAAYTYLTTKRSIDADRLKFDGRGERELKDVSNPNSGANRRVEVRRVQGS
ncbi:MAG: OmpA family protein [Maricaulaceae bacterium]